MSARTVRWGQNFLADRSIACDIVDWAAIEGKAVVEVGPGRGALSGLLAERAQRLIMVEIDPRLAQRGCDLAAGDPRISVVEADVLKLDPSQLCSGPYTMVSNLPYESGTAIVDLFLRRSRGLERMVVMLQREVAARLQAPPGSRSYGILSVMTALRADVETGMDVPPAAFKPAPKVWSRVLRISPIAAPRYQLGDEALFSDLLKSAFRHRRKMLRNTLLPRMAALVGEEAAVGVLESAGVEAEQRPEQVSVSAFASISRQVHGLLEGA